MKNPLKVLVSILALGVMAASPLLRAADEKTPAGETPKGGRAGRAGGGGGRGGMMNAEERITAIEKAVGGLTEDQKSKIKDVFAKSQEKMREQMQAARSAGDGGDRQAMRAKMEEMTKATHGQVRALLTADQQKKFDEMPAPARGGGAGKGARKKDN
jgi:hypothetical protein